MERKKNNKKLESISRSFWVQPVLIDILDLVDFLLNALAGDAVGLQLVHLLVNQVRDGLVEILQEVLDHLGDDVIRLLVLVLTLICQIRFRITCRHRRISNSV